MNCAIVVAAGSSRRMGFNKLLAPLAGRPVLLRSLLAFCRCQEIDEVIVVGGDEVEGSIALWRHQVDLSKVSAVVQGGAQRHLSVLAGLQRCPADCQRVAVHDGARPLISPEQISACLRAAASCGAAACARPMTETLKRVDDQGRICGSIEREGAWIMETPQVFDLALLRQAYAEVIASGQLVTDEVSALQLLGLPVEVVSNPQPNPKITFPQDLEWAAKWIEPQEPQA
jgi:2-C-methyl-D-erythritol 4-phosphate cytidylyltransferase